MCRRTDSPVGFELQTNQGPDLYTAAYTFVAARAGIHRFKNLNGKIGVNKKPGRTCSSVSRIQRPHSTESEVNAMVWHFSEDGPGRPDFWVKPTWICILLSLICFLGCGVDKGDDFFQPPNVEPIRATIKTAVPLAHVAAVSMAAIQGRALNNVLSADGCSRFPCAALIYIELFPNDLPFAFDAGGTAVVAGLWTSPNQAVLTVSFSEVEPGVPGYRVSMVSTFPVITTQTPESGFKLVFADMDINIAGDPDDSIDLTDPQIQAEYNRLENDVSDDPEINLSMDAWVVELADAGTPDVFIDDRYTISGGGQFLDVTADHGATSDVDIHQLGMVRARISHACSHNPTDGMAFIQDVSTSSSLPILATALLEFRNTCNASVYVELATGNYIIYTGSSVGLDLNDP